MEGLSCDESFDGSDDDGDGFKSQGSSDDDNELLEKQEAESDDNSFNGDEGGVQILDNAEVLDAPRQVEA
eukprot:scaffold3022_cov42-Cyclotella_meneghiniana.AAC.6